MKKIYFVALLAIGLLLGGCSQQSDNGEAVEVAKSQISIELPVGVARTAIDDGGRASWTEGDTFALWAENKTGAFKLNGAKFSMMYYWHSLQSAVFTSNTNALAEGEYTYYAAAPMPENFTNNKASYTIPADQQGDSFNGAYDIMVAEPIVAEALSADKLNNLALDFRHKMHTLKLIVAENNFDLGVAKLQFEFPSPVVGDVGLDVLNPDAALTFSNGNNTLTISSTRALNVGDTLYGLVVPSNINGEVKLTAFSALGQKSIVRTFNISKEMKEGHITPMSLVIPEPFRKTVIRFSIGGNNLGEAVQKLYIVDNNGSTIATFNTNSLNTYEMVHEGDIAKSNYMSYGGKQFTARFESANAIVEQKFTMPAITAYTTVVVPTFTVPYLLFEDFSEAKSYSQNDSYTPGTNNDRTTSGYLLNGYMPADGWNASRFKIEGGQSARINVRYQSGAWVVERVCGRLDTPAMKALKSGANVTLKVTFDAGFHIPVGYNRDDSGSANAFFKIGRHTNSESSAIGGTNQNEIGSACTVAHTSDNYGNNVGNGSFSSILPTVSYNISGCTSSTRIVWWPCTHQDASVIAANSCYYLYIDNIRVSIAQ